MRVERSRDTWSTGKEGGLEAQALGRSRGGFGTKLHAVVDALGLPVRFALGPGQQNDMAPACDLIRGFDVRQVIADRAYDADSLCDLVRAHVGAAAPLVS